MPWHTADSLPSGPSDLSLIQICEKAVDDSVGGLLDHDEGFGEALVTTEVGIGDREVRVRLGQVGRGLVIGAEHSQRRNVGTRRRSGTRYTSFRCQPPGRRYLPNGWHRI